MSTKYQTVNLKLDVAARARAVAAVRNIPLAALLADLINEAHAALGITMPKVAEIGTAAGSEIAIELQDANGPRTITFPKASAANVAKLIASFADSDPRQRVHMDLDLDCMLTVSRRGPAVVIEGFDNQNQQARETMSARDALRLAAEIEAFA